MKGKALFLGKKFLEQKLVKSITYIFIGTLIANIFNFLFNLFMSRNLAVEDYGILTSAISLIVLITIPLGAVVPTVVNFAGSRFAKEEYEEVSIFFLKIIKPLILIGFIFLFCFIIFAKGIGDFFNIQDQSLIVIVGLTVFVVYLGIINTGVLQAKLEFKFISLSNIISTFIKFSLGVFLVFLGFGIKGVIWVLFFSNMALFVISFIPLRFIFRIKRKTQASTAIDYRNLLSYGIPSSLATLGLASLISTDILLVKHFYDPQQAGIYAGLSLGGRVIFFLTAPIATVMFPLIVQKHERRENYNNIFKISIALVFVPSILISIFYFLYPDFAIGFFIKNKVYLSVSRYLGLFAVFITIYSLISLFVYYFLSIKKTKIYIPIVFSAMAQALLINLYHDSFFKVIIISLLVSLVLLVLVLSYYIKVITNRNKF